MINILELKSISAGYKNSVSKGKNGSRTGKVVLGGIDLSVCEGELLVLAGPNGSGKSTLLKTAGGLIPPLKGRVMINGKDINKIKARERASLTAFLFQVRDSPWPFTVRETVAQGRFARQGWFGVENKKDREVISGALEKTGLIDFAERPIIELSGGELQRVYIARCIAQEAAFLLLDEPENNLDPKYSFMILSLLSELVREGCGAIVSLHDLRLASYFASRIALLSLTGVGGKISAIGTPIEVLTPENLSKVYNLNDDLVRRLIL